MKFLQKELHIDFTGKFKLFSIISTVAVILGFGLFMFKGLEYGVDFKGGTEIQLKIDNVATDEVRQAVEPFGKVMIQQFEGKSNEFLLRLPNISIADTKDIEKYINDVKGEVSAKLIKEHYDAEVGDRIELWFDKAIDKSKLTEIIEGYNIPTTGKIEYKQLGERHIYKIMLQGLTSKIVSTINEKTGQKSEVLRVELVGPKVGQKLRVDAFMAVLYALIFILVYIAIRFNYQFAPGAVAALIHDVFITLGVLSFFKISFDLTIVAALMTIVGYSLNDTIVIYDRIRENWNNAKKGKTVTEKINTSLNETVSRTLITSLTTLLVLIALIIWGGGIIKGFAISMTIGVVIGTYSSIFVASPVTVFVQKYMKKEKVA